MSLSFGKSLYPRAKNGISVLSFRRSKYINHSVTIFIVFRGACYSATLAWLNKKGIF